MNPLATGMNGREREAERAAAAILALGLILPRKFCAEGVLAGGRGALGRAGKGGPIGERDPMEVSESSNSPADSAKASSEVDRIGDGERAFPAATLRELSDGAGRRRAERESGVSSGVLLAVAESATGCALGEASGELLDSDSESFS